MSILFDPRLGAPPAPPDPWEAERWQFTALAERILDGCWGSDLEDWLIAHYGIIRRDALGPRDLSSNVLRTISTQLSALYDESPTVSHPSGDYAELLAGSDPDGETEPGLIASTGLWSMMQDVQARTIALGDYLVHVSYTPDDGLLYRAVSPAAVLADARPSAPDRPVVLRELRRRSAPMDPSRSIWTWDVYDISDRVNPSYRILSASKTKAVGVGDDLTSDYLPELAVNGSAYFWKDSNGNPKLPYVVYRRARSGKLWSPYLSRELVDGTLTVAALWTDWVHAVRDCSWLQRYLIGAEIAGGSTAGAPGSPWTSVPVDRASILVLAGSGDGQPIAGAFPAPSDPSIIGRSISDYESRLALWVGINPSDLSRTSGDPRSGYALEVSEHGKEQAQRRYLPTFRQADQELIGLTALILNRATGTDYPESGYRIRYAHQGPAASAGVTPGAPIGEQTPAAAPVKIALTSTDIASIVTVDEARASQGLPGIGGTEGALTVAEYQAKNATVIAAAANATAGAPVPSTSTE